jgi:hypothetical protein
MFYHILEQTTVGKTRFLAFTFYSSVWNEILVCFQEAK